MADDKVVDITKPVVKKKAKEPPKPPPAAIGITIPYPRGLDRARALMDYKMDTLEKMGIPATGGLRVQSHCGCGIVWNWSDATRIPLYSCVCPDCDKFIIKWKPE